MGIENVKALTFDVGGTVFEWQSATRNAVGANAAERGAEIDVPAFCLEWRRDMSAIWSRFERASCRR